MPGYLYRTGAPFDVQLVIFGKDGTLLDWDATWLPAMRECAEAVPVFPVSARLALAHLRALSVGVRLSARPLRIRFGVGSTPSGSCRTLPTLAPACMCMYDM